MAAKRVNDRPIVKRPNWLRRLPPGVHRFEFLGIDELTEDGAYVLLGDPARKKTTVARVWVRNPWR